MITYQTDMEIYRRSVKDVRCLKQVKRHLGQNSASTADEEPDTEDDDQDDEATNSALRDQTNQDGAEGQDNLPPQA